MIARLDRPVRFAAMALFAMAIALPGSAQGQQTEGRWQAWLGCWTPPGTLIRVIGTSSAPIVCVVPSSTASSVDIVTAASGKILDSTHVDADGQPHAISKEGCAGWQTAKWSPSGRRIYLKSEFNCNGAPATHVSALYAMAGTGEWIDVQSMRVDKNVGVHAVRYRQAADAGTLPEAFARKLPAHTLASTAAMLAATEPPSLTEVEEASHELEPSVVSTWLIEADRVATQKPVPVNAKQLEQLADHGVPASVIDAIVGLSYPNSFVVNPAGQDVARQNGEGVLSGNGAVGSSYASYPIIGFDRFGLPIYASESAMMYGCSPFLYGPNDLMWSPYAQMACGGYGFGSGMYPYFGGYPYYGGYGYYGRGPVIVPVTNAPSGTGTASHGRVVNGKGYTQGGSGSSGTAVPRSNNSSSSNSGGNTSAGASSGAAASSPPARTAEPRKP
jgi:hypothetical protein